jgi:Ankyrin repeats (3 copies)
MRRLFYATRFTSTSVNALRHIDGVSLLDSIEERDLSAVKALLAGGLSADGNWWRRLFVPDDPTPLIAAVMARDPEIVACLLDFGADPNLETRKWMTPLAVACQEGNRVIAEMLASRGAVVNPRTGYQNPTPIEAAAWRGHEDLVAFLLERGANPDSVFARGTGSLIRISRPILARLIAAGGHAPPDVEALVNQERW